MDQTNPTTSKTVSMGGTACKNESAVVPSTPPSESFSKILIVAGPSGVGKSTVIKKIMECIPNTFAFSVSHTTRQPRPGEVDGINYHFTTKEVMEQLISEDKFIEQCDVHGNMYGTSKMEIERLNSENKIAVLDIDIQGCQKIKKRHDVLQMNPVYIRIKIAYEELEKRLTGRGTETPESLKIRLDNAKAELEPMPGFFNLEVENQVVEDCAKELVSFLETVGVLGLQEDGSSHATCIK
ncbi:putative Guanylate kinase 1 [Blattamonas nauphoetae]|uniref:guanylate kinase n=1 Tax=Blattamonas nauphoetae TaxID=2049346 RepID=A0ABQ9XJH9_9EUKA|nr:putative Guanylate kinase 1 [Blattamonas nauphoetae]